MTKRSVGVLILAGLVFTGGCQTTLQSLVLRPSETFRMTPADFGLSFEGKSIPGKENTEISIWHVKAVGERKGIVVIVPGNDANKGRYAIGLPVFVEAGWDVILMDYEGFGESTGAPSFDGLIRSTFTVVDYAKTLDDTVVGFGVSLGTAVLARVAAERDFTAVIFESFTDVWSEPSLFAGRHLFSSPVWAAADAIAALSTTQDYNSRHWITLVTEPKLFLHSPDDNVTPYDGAWQLFKLAPQPKHFFVTQGEHALQLFIDPVMYREIVSGWLDGITQADPILNQRFQEILDTEVRATLEELGFAPAAP